MKKFKFITLFLFLTAITAVLIWLAILSPVAFIAYVFSAAILAMIGVVTNEILNK